MNGNPQSDRSVPDLTSTREKSPSPYSVLRGVFQKNKCSVMHDDHAVLTTSPFGAEICALSMLSEMYFELLCY